MKFDNMGEDSERDSFMKRLAAFNESRGVSMTSSPTISKQPLDLFVLYTIVKDKGGFQEVSKIKGWKEVATVCNCMVNPSAAYAIRKQYIKHLLPFECKFDRGGIDHTTLIPQVESKSKKSKDAMSPGHSDSNSQSGFPPTPGSMEPPSSPYPSGPSPIGNNYPPGYPQSSGFKDFFRNISSIKGKKMVEDWFDVLVGINLHTANWVYAKVVNLTSTDSNSQGSYPQSTTPVQFEGPYPGHRQPPPGQGYPENQNYPHQGAMNDYGPNHHPGQPSQQPPQQPPSNYGHLGGHLPPGIQQQMSQPPRQQSQHQNRKMMKGGDNNYPQPGNPAIGSHYPPPPHPGSTFSSNGSAENSTSSPEITMQKKRTKLEAINIEDDFLKHNHNHLTLSPSHSSTTTTTSGTITFLC